MANLLNNRLQGNNTGIDSSTTTSAGGSSSLATPSAASSSSSSSSTTLTMCPSSSQNLPHSSSPQQQLPLQHPVSQQTTPQSLSIVNQRRTLSNLTNSCKTIHQVNSYGTAVAAAAAAARAGTLSQSPSPVAISATRTPFYGYEPSFKRKLYNSFIYYMFSVIVKKKFNLLT